MTEPDKSATDRSRVWKATLAAAVLAAVILAFLLWPSERILNPNVEQTAPVTDGEPVGELSAEDELAALIEGNVRDAAPGVHVSRDRPFKSEVVEVPLASLEEVEIKAHMQPGDTLLYSWSSPQPLYVDMHGEPYTYPDDPVARYEEVDGVSAAHGRVTVPFAGMHGWFWLNTSEEPVVVRLEVSGFYDRLEEVYRSSP